MKKQPYISAEKSLSELNDNNPNIKPQIGD